MINLTELAPGEGVHAPLLVCEVDQRGSRDQPFAVLTLGNASGRIASAPFWPESLAQIAGIARGDIVEVLGEVTLYRDRRQLRVSSIRSLPIESVDWKDMLPSAGTPTRCWEALDRWRNSILSPRLAAVLALFFDDADFRRRFEQCPASVWGHHAVLGGLLHHTWEVAAIGREMAATSGADGDLVLAGALLHDIGKLEAYDWHRGFSLTTRGHLLGHVVLGSLMLERQCRAMKPLPVSEMELEILQHLILSHHGILEHGAAIEPMTLEAEVLHYADIASARTRSMGDALHSGEHFTGDELISARGLWQLDGRRIFRGKSQWGL